MAKPVSAVHRRFEHAGWLRIFEQRLSRLFTDQTRRIRRTGCAGPNHPRDPQVPGTQCTRLRFTSGAGWKHGCSPTDGRGKREHTEPRKSRPPCRARHPLSINAASNGERAGQPVGRCNKTDFHRGESPDSSYRGQLAYGARNHFEYNKKKETIPRMMSVWMKAGLRLDFTRQRRATVASVCPRASTPSLQ